MKSRRLIAVTFKWLGNSSLARRASLKYQGFSQPRCPQMGHERRFSGAPEKSVDTPTADIQAAGAKYRNVPNCDIVHVPPSEPSGQSYRKRVIDDMLSLKQAAVSGLGVV